jgi:hypothetical protein
LYLFVELVALSGLLPGFCGGEPVVVQLGLNSDCICSGKSNQFVLRTSLFVRAIGNHCPVRQKRGIVLYYEIRA